MATATTYLPREVQNRKDFDVRAGDSVKVHLKIQEKGKTRIQTFEGLVLARKHGKENGGTITVRKVSNGIGVERIFPIYSPNIDSIEVVRRSRVRRSKLYFLRDAVAKTMRYKLRRITDLGISTKDFPEVPEEIVEEVSEKGESTTEEVAAEEAVSENTETEKESKEEAPAEEAPQEAVEAETAVDESAEATSDDSESKEQKEA